MKRITSILTLFFNGKKERKDSYRPLIVLSLITISLWLFSYLIIKYTVEDRGTFGDSFGAINALFSGLAFGGIIYTILLQRKELTLQREELQLTREELKRTANAQEESNKFQMSQLRLSNLPILEYSITEQDQNILLFTLENTSRFYAFDLQIITCITYKETDLNQKQFLSTNIKNSFKKADFKFQIDEDQCWRIKNTQTVTSFSTNKKAELNFRFPNSYFYFQILVQYRDSLNNNYLQVLHYSKYRKNKISFTDIHPKTPQPIKRFNSGLYRQIDNKHQYIADFNNYLKNSIEDNVLDDKMNITEIKLIKTH